MLFRGLNVQSQQALANGLRLPTHRLGFRTAEVMQLGVLETKSGGDAGVPHRPDIAFHNGER